MLRQNDAEGRFQRTLPKWLDQGCRERVGRKRHRSTARKQEPLHHPALEIGCTRLLLSMKPLFWVWSSNRNSARNGLGHSVSNFIHITFGSLKLRLIHSKADLGLSLNSRTVLEVNLQHSNFWSILHAKKKDARVSSLPGGGKKVTEKVQKRKVSNTENL